MMTKKEKLELATIVANAVVEAMKASSAKPTAANEGKKTKTSHKPYSGNIPEVSEHKLLLEAKKGRGSKAATTPKYSTNLKDYEPKKNDGFYNWASYKSNRTKFCYAYATGGKAIGCFENGQRYCTFDQIEDEYAKAKKMFEKKFHYTKKADR